MTILVLGGKGQTSKPLASILQLNHVPFIVGSRSPTDDGFSRHIRFDWLDESTYDAVFDGNPDGVEAVYMVPPEVSDCLTPMKRFIDHMRQKGTKRFVLLSSSAIAKGGPFFGAVHDYLSAIDVEYEVLRPSWFQRTLNTYLVLLQPTDIWIREFHQPQASQPWNHTGRQNILGRTGWTSAFRFGRGYRCSCLPLTDR